VSPEKKKKAKKSKVKKTAGKASSVPVDSSAPSSGIANEQQDLYQKALDSFFASDSEMTETASESLDLYRDLQDARLRASGLQEYLSFVLADEVFAVSIYHIKEIIKLPLITEVPRTASVILGILSLRGTVVPVVDLRLRLNLTAGPRVRKTRILIVQSESGLLGLLVDEVRQVIRLREEDIESTPGVFDRAEAEHIVGVGRQDGEMYTLLDLDAVVPIDKFINVRSGSPTA